MASAQIWTAEQIDDFAHRKLGGLDAGLTVGQNSLPQRIGALRMNRIASYLHRVLLPSAGTTGPITYRKF